MTDLSPADAARLEITQAFDAHVENRTGITQLIGSLWIAADRLSEATFEGAGRPEWINRITTLQAALEAAQAELAQLHAPTDDAMEVATAIVDADDWERFSETEPYDWEKLIGKIAAAITAAEARARKAEREALRKQLGYHLNNYLCEMEEGWDDSVVGFNTAWKVMDGVFDNPTPKESERQAGVREGIEMAAQERAALESVEAAARAFLRQTVKQGRN